MFLAAVTVVLVGLLSMLWMFDGRASVKEVRKWGCDTLEGLFRAQVFVRHPLAATITRVIIYLLRGVLFVGGAIFVVLLALLCLEHISDFVCSDPKLATRAMHVVIWGFLSFLFYCGREWGSIVSDNVSDSWDAGKYMLVMYAGIGLLGWIVDVGEPEPRLSTFTELAVPTTLGVLRGLAQGRVRKERGEQL